MPIKGISDRDASFPKIGDLRKGEEKKGNRPGRDLDYFRFTGLPPNSAEIEAAFREAYGDKPRRINIRLPFETIDENFSAWKELWGSGGLHHRCDGEWVYIMREGDSYKRYRPGQMPCPGGCKEKGELRVLIPELHRLAYVSVHTTSILDILELTGNLKALRGLTGGNLMGIPLSLYREPRMVSVKHGGTRSRKEMWMLHIEADPQWTRQQFAYMELQAAPGYNAPQIAAHSGLIIDEETGEIYEEEEGTTVPAFDYEQVFSLVREARKKFGGLPPVAAAKMVETKVREAYPDLAESFVKQLIEQTPEQEPVSEESDDAIEPDAEWEEVTGEE